MLAYFLFEGRPLTTRGQWINPLVFMGFAAQRKLPKLKSVKAPIFILGTGRSGTTILGIVLSMHRSIGFLNEPKAVWAALRDDEDLIGSYHRGAARYRLGAQDVSAKDRKGAHRIFGAYLRTAFCSRVVDKYPEMIFRVPYLREIFPDARFLFLSRNGWDTCVSIDTWSDRLGQHVGDERHDWWGADDRKWKLLVEQIVTQHTDFAPHKAFLEKLTNHQHRAVVEWTVTMREGLALLKDNPGDVLHVPFERLCADTEAVISEISHFAGLGTDTVFKDYALKTLRPVNAREPFEMPEVLLGPFLDTQEKLAQAK